MTTQYFNWSGTVKWAKTNESQRDTTFNPAGNYTINLYPDDETWAIIETSGLRLTRRTDEDGDFITFRRPHSAEIQGKQVVHGPPTVYLNKEEYLGAIGNGSIATINVAVYDTRHGKGHRFNGINVTTLVPYVSGFDLKDEMPFDPDE